MAVFTVGDGNGQYPPALRRVRRYQSPAGQYLVVRMRGNNHQTRAGRNPFLNTALLAPFIGQPAPPHMLPRGLVLTQRGPFYKRHDGSPGLKGVPLLASVAQDALPDHMADAKLAMFIGTPGVPASIATECRNPRTKIASLWARMTVASMQGSRCRTRQHVAIIESAFDKTVCTLTNIGRHAGLPVISAALGMNQLKAASRRRSLIRCDQTNGRSHLTPGQIQCDSAQ